MNTTWKLTVVVEDEKNITEGGWDVTFCVKGPQQNTLMSYLNGLPHKKSFVRALVSKWVAVSGSYPERAYAILKESHKLLEKNCPYDYEDNPKADFNYLGNAEMLVQEISDIANRNNIDVEITHSSVEKEWVVQSDPWNPCLIVLVRNTWEITLEVS